MDAIIGRLPGRQIEAAASDWLRATRRLVRAVVRGAGHVLVYYSRPAMLLRGSGRPFRRI
ncbi:hypothetical protein D3C83_77100 [compost metagenome]